jgi:hypothetical protein
MPPMIYSLDLLCNDSLFETRKRIPEVKRIIFNDPATVVFWKDGTKTVVKCMKDEKFSPYHGFLCALGKKIYGSNSAIQRLVHSYMEEE